MTRIVSLAGVESVSHPTHGEAEAGPDGVFDLPGDFAADLLKQRGLWRDEAAHVAAQARESIRRLSDPRHAREVLAELHRTVDQLKATVADMQADLDAQADEIAALRGDDAGQPDEKADGDAPVEPEKAKKSKKATPKPE